MSEKYLRPIEDGLTMRVSQPYARYKLASLRLYLHITNTSMREKWKYRSYLDLQAGPGKNQIDSEVILGSPLIALTAPHAATHFYFNDHDEENVKALAMRVSASSLKDAVSISQQDVNEAVHRICDHLPPDADSLNAAFLDPEGLEIQWITVQRLAKVKRMDLIINFSVSGIKRAIGAGNYASVTAFFGTEEWQSIYNQSSPSLVTRNLIDFYLNRLQGFNYITEIDPNIGGMEISAKNSKNAEVYRMIFASKHPLGERFWNESVKLTQQPRLL